METNSDLPGLPECVVLKAEMKGEYLMLKLGFKQAHRPRWVNKSKLQIGGWSFKRLSNEMLPVRDHIERQHAAYYSWLTLQPAGGANA